MKHRVSFIGVLALVSATLALAPSSAAAAGGTTVYGSIPATLPGNVPSVGYEATSTSELGDLVQVGPGPRHLTTVDVVLSSWGCEDGSWVGGDCATTPGATFSHALTLNVYEVGPGNTVGSLIASKPSTFDIPYRPSADIANCGDGRWWDGSACYNGFAVPVTWDFSGDGITLPSQVIWTVAYNTTNHGAAPIGTGAACYTEPGGCGYDSLNVGVETFPGAPFAGIDVDPDGAFLSSTWGGAYCDDGVGGTGFLREDTAAGCWTDYKPLAAIHTDASTLTQGTVVVEPGNMNGWAFVQEISDGSGSLISGPAPTPLGSGSAQLTVDATGRELLLTGAFAGTRFDRITTLGFHSYRDSIDPGTLLSLSLQFDVDYDLTDSVGSWQGRLVFEPYQTVGNTIADRTWYQWSPLDGVWWASGSPGNQTCGQATPCEWLDVLALWPNAGIRVGGAGFPGMVQFKAGGPWTDGFVGNVDAFVIGVDDGAGNIAETTFDFEPGNVLGSCLAHDDAVNLVLTLLADCTTDQTVLVPNAYTLDGNGYTIFAVDPSGGHFLGAVVKNAADADTANVTNLTVQTVDLADVCDGGTDRLRGIMLEGAAGAITNNTVDVGQGAGGRTGCQEGNAIEVRNEPFDTNGADVLVTVSGNTILSYVKGGIVANGSVAATITGNTITGWGPVGVPFAAQNGIQVGFGGTATIRGNSVSGNDYTPRDWVACGLLYYQADGIRASANTLFDNERDVCNFGRGGGQYNPSS